MRTWHIVALVIVGLIVLGIVFIENFTLYEKKGDTRKRKADSELLKNAAIEPKSSKIPGWGDKKQPERNTDAWLAIAEERKKQRMEKEAVEEYSFDDLIYY